MSAVMLSMYKENNYDGPRCYIHVPSFVEIGPLVLEEISEGFLPYRDVAAILVI